MLQLQHAIGHRQMASNNRPQALCNKLATHRKNGHERLSGIVLLRVDGVAFKHMTNFYKLFVHKFFGSAEKSSNSWPGAAL